MAGLYMDVNNEYDPNDDSEHETESSFSFDDHTDSEVSCGTIYASNNKGSDLYDSSIGDENAYHVDFDEPGSEAPKSDTKAPAKKAENTPGKPSDHETPLTLTAISVDAQTPDSPTSQHAEEGEENDTDHNSEDDSDHSSDNEEDYEDLYSGETTDPADVTGRKEAIDIVGAEALGVVASPSAD
ncbi:hypothetical protein F5883DRAFT_655945 [Diaporthe sp. PMI_573]|nr:hypothetical protein F5883DRAFT_655945 [Diaporthaceae sp. PMI_573]